ncbi:MULTISPECIES: GNAT family N-acetyltransferase [unclassified Haladaptatus]|uniref:GNAT family N-acetyltransferase n=1 Tax=unclassified Haladaptatus TaxID=2622732 RepID=UPI0023E80DA0|nr:MULTISPECIES: GNAT family N-acetyltransferase [unclassified Haladaptatus]
MRSAIHVVETDGEYEDALSVRFTVFVDEQGVPEELEVDEYEDDCIHFVAYVDDEAVGAARLRPIDADTAKVERVAVLDSHRGNGLGFELMACVESEAHERGYDHLILNAQTHAKPFYDRLGYLQVGDEFEEAGIPHVQMDKVF